MSFPATDGPRRCIVVTDSTASFSSQVADVVVVPLQVVVGEQTFREGIEISSADLRARLGSGEFATTSQPSVAAFSSAYRQAEALGATEVVSVHISGELSGTVHAAALAAKNADIPVRVINSRTIAGALGFAVEAAARAARAGAEIAQVSEIAMTIADSSATYFSVDTLDHLRRGGRLGRTLSTVGTVLGVKPILAMCDGKIELAQVVRNRRSALARLVELVGKSLPDDGPGSGSRSATDKDLTLDRDWTEDSDALFAPRLAVHHFADEEAGLHLARLIEESTGIQPAVLEVGAVIGAHAGPGVLGVVRSVGPIIR